MGGLIPGGLGPLRTRILQVAIGELGVREDPPGSNRGPKLDKYLPSWARSKAKGPAWCCYFVSWVLHEALGKYPTGQLRGMSLALKEDAEERGLWKPKWSEPPVPGDAFVMDIGNDGGDGHVGLVLRLTFDATKIETIEGNSGNRVRLGMRDLTDPQILGFVHTVEGERTDDVERGLSGKGVPIAKASTR